jgi:protein-S-isoprenylcysteine O-methyltransferase Ste14
MHAAVKIIIGLVLVLIGLGLFVDSVYPLMGVRGTLGIDWLGNFIVVLTGTIPIFLILIGLFVVWLEADELKTSKEFEEPVETEEKKKPRKK